jgi:hypothetical protein
LVVYRLLRVAGIENASVYVIVSTKFIVLMACKRIASNEVAVLHQGIKPRRLKNPQMGAESVGA